MRGWHRWTAVAASLSPPAPSLGAGLIQPVPASTLLDTARRRRLLDHIWERTSKVRNEAVLACNRLGRRIWKVWSGYHRRSLVETKMHCFKRLGERVMARTFERQVVELHVRVVLLNRFSQLGRPVTVAMA